MALAPPLLPSAGDTAVETVVVDRLVVWRAEAGPWRGGRWGCKPGGRSGSGVGTGAEGAGEAAGGSWPDSKGFAWRSLMAAWETARAETLACG